MPKNLVEALAKITERVSLDESKPEDRAINLFLIGHKRDKDEIEQLAKKAGMTFKDVGALALKRRLGALHHGARPVTGVQNDVKKEVARVLQIARTWGMVPLARKIAKEIMSKKEGLEEGWDSDALAKSLVKSAEKGADLKKLKVAAEWGAKSAKKVNLADAVRKAQKMTKDAGARKALAKLLKMVEAKEGSGVFTEGDRSELVALAEEEAAMDPLEYNTKLSKLLKKLKKDAGASSIRQNYRGTGSQKFRRQLWVNFKSGAVIDLWLEKSSLGLGGVVKRRADESKPPHPMPKRISYEGKTPEQVYREAAALLKRWAD